MADHFPGEITIGGDIPLRLLDSLSEMIASENVSIDWQYALDKRRSARPLNRLPPAARPSDLRTTKPAKASLTSWSRSWSGTGFTSIVTAMPATSTTARMCTIAAGAGPV